MKVGSSGATGFSASSACATPVSMAAEKAAATALNFMVVTGGVSPKLNLGETEAQ